MALARLTRLQLTALVFTALVTACGGSSSSNTGSNTSGKTTPTVSSAQQVASVDSCKLVTAEEASTAVGSTVTSQPGGGSFQQVSMCIYGSSDSQAIVYVIAEVLPDKASAQSIQPEAFAAYMNASGVSNAKVVSGIGDKAVEYTTSGSSSSSGIAILVIKSNVVLMIAMAPGSDSTKIEAMARTAVGRL